MVPISDRRGRESPASVKPVNTTATPKKSQNSTQVWGNITDYVVYAIGTGMRERFMWVSGRQMMFLTIRRGWLCRRLVLLCLWAAALRSWAAGAWTWRLGSPCLASGPRAREEPCRPWVPLKRGRLGALRTEARARYFSGPCWSPVRSGPSWDWLSSGWGWVAVAGSPGRGWPELQEPKLLPRLKWDQREVQVSALLNEKNQGICRVFQIKFKAF